MYCDSEDTDSDDGFEMYTGRALEVFLKVDPQSFTFIKYILQITKPIRCVYPNCRLINFDRDMTKYKTFLSELKGFLKDLGCPYKEFTSACIELAIENKHCRRRLINFLNSEYTSAMKIDRFFLNQVNRIQNSFYNNSKYTPGTSSCTNYEQDKSDDKDTVPNNENNVIPGEDQSSQIPQVVEEAAKKEITLENKFGELTIDTQQPSPLVIPTLQQNYASQVHRNTGVAQYGNSGNNLPTDGSMQGGWIQSGRYHNFPGNQNVLPNQQQGYRPPAFNHNYNYALQSPHNTVYGNQTVRPIQTDWINALNQNSQGIWNSQQPHCNQGMLQGANQNRVLNDNIRYSLNHQSPRNVPIPFSHNQNLNAQRPAFNYTPELWNTRGSGNIPITQNNHQGWISQGPRNIGMSLFGNNYNDQQVGRVQGGEYLNQRIYGNMQHQLNNQQNYRPPAYQNMNILRPQETYVSRGDGATYYITNISIYHGQEGGSGQLGIAGLGALYSGIDNGIQRRGNMPYREYQNPSCNGQNTNSHGPRY